MLSEFRGEEREQVRLQEPLRHFGETCGMDVVVAARGYKKTWRIVIEDWDEAKSWMES